MKKIALFLCTCFLLSGCGDSRADCDIKGNIGKDGSKIYHMPKDEWYSKTMIDTQTGEKWFCSEMEAEKAGWRRAFEYSPK